MTAADFSLKFYRDSVVVLFFYSWIYFILPLRNEWIKYRQVKPTRLWVISPRHKTFISVNLRSISCVAFISETKLALLAPELEEPETRANNTIFSVIRQSTTTWLSNIDSFFYPFSLTIHYHSFAADFLGLSRKIRPISCQKNSLNKSIFN